MNKLLILGFALLSVGAVSLIVAIAMEIYTRADFWEIMIKVSAGVFGLSGPIIGLAIARRRSNKNGD